MELTSVLAVDYIDPALEGQIIIIKYACSPGQILNGSNTSTCMGNGEWEPDPGEARCNGGFITTYATPTFMIRYIL